MKAVPDQIRQFVPNEFATLGADGFGFSDTRAAARRFFKNDTHSIVVHEFATLGADGFGFSDTRAAARRFFKNDTHSIVVRALEMLARRGEVDAGAPVKAIEKYKLLNVNAGTTGNTGGEA
ncbi:hypothetical protein ASF64_15285 [Arthrobacter sp. Leaf137]|nr:hypothetical protein ASF64_15285 [Arthrobacter sp. Leaf137]